MNFLKKQTINLVMALCSLPCYAAPSYNEMNDIGGMGGSPLSLAALIGVAHGAPILAISIYSKKKWLLILTTALMTYIAFAAGKLSYVGYDLFFISVSAALSWFFIADEVKSNNLKYQPPKLDSPPTSELGNNNESMTLATGFIIIISILATGLFIFSRTGNNRSESQPNQIQEAKKDQTPISKAIETEPKVPQTKIVRPSKKTDVRNCLSLNSNAEIARCASNR